MAKHHTTVSAVVLITVTLLLLPLVAYFNQAMTGSYGIQTYQNNSINFTWQDIDGEHHQFTDWQQGPTFLFLGFLSCSQICPIRTHQMQQVMSQLDQHQQQNVRFMFVTIDPQNDAIAMRRQRIDDVSPQFFSAELTEASLATLEQQLIETSSHTNGIAQHAGRLYLLSATGQLLQTYTHQQLNIDKLLTELHSAMASI